MIYFQLKYNYTSQKEHALRVLCLDPNSILLPRAIHNSSIHNLGNFYIGEMILVQLDFCSVILFKFFMLNCTFLAYRPPLTCYFINILYFTNIFYFANILYFTNISKLYQNMVENYGTLISKLSRCPL